MITEKQFKRGILTFFLLIVIGIAIWSARGMEKPEIRNTFDEAITQGEFPCYQLADSLYGIDSRGTDIWCEIAYCDRTNEGRQYTAMGDEYYEYHINLHMDTVWLYNEDNELVVKGHYDSLLNFIELDNL